MPGRKDLTAPPQKALEALAALQRVSDRERSELWLVGGAVRDALLGRDPERLDLDFAHKGETLPFAEAFAEETGGTYFPLKEQERSARVVLPRGDVFDFVGMAAGIDEDLARRDFTIDAMALPLGAYLSGTAEILDPFDGRGDLSRRLVRAVSDRSFADDPLRMLRAFRLAAVLGFDVDGPTLRLIGRDRELISRTAAERIARELFLTLDSLRAAELVRQLDSVGLLEQVLPEVRDMKGVTQNEYHHLDVWEHSLEALACLDELLGDLPGLVGTNAARVDAYLCEQLVPDRSRRALLSLAVLLHDMGKPSRRAEKAGRTIFYGHDAQGARMMEAVCGRLKLSTRETREATVLVKRHMVLIELSASKELPLRRRLRFFRRAGGELGVALLLLSLADRSATRGAAAPVETLARSRDMAASLVGDWYGWVRETLENPPLVTGHDLMRELDLPAGESLGRVLEHVRTAQLEGDIKTREEALEHAEEIAKRRGGRK